MSDECPFCKAVAEHKTPYSSHEPSVLILKPLNPVTDGHTLIILNRHVSDALEDAELTGKMFEMAVHQAQYLKYHCDDVTGFNLITSAGASASQTVFHLHIHVVPRRDNDGLKLPWTDQKKEDVSA